VHHGLLVLGALRLAAAEHRDGTAMRVFYRPEDVILAPAGYTDHPGRFATTVQQISPTVPLARINMGPTPRLSALVHRRDLDRLDLQVGGSTEVLLTSAAIQLWPTPST